MLDDVLFHQTFCFYTISKKKKIGANFKVLPDRLLHQDMTFTETQPYQMDSVKTEVG